MDKTKRKELSLPFTQASDTLRGRPHDWVWLGFMEPSPFIFPFSCLLIKKKKKKTKKSTKRLVKKPNLSFEADTASLLFTIASIWCACACLWVCIVTEKFKWKKKVYEFTLNKWYKTREWKWKGTHLKQNAPLKWQQIHNIAGDMCHKQGIETFKKNLTNVWRWNL